MGIPIRKIGPQLPKVEPVTTWPKPETVSKPYIKRPRKDGEPDESGDRAK